MFRAIFDEFDESFEVIYPERAGKELERSNSGSEPDNTRRNSGENPVEAEPCEIVSCDDVTTAPPPPPCTPGEQFVFSLSTPPLSVSKDPHYFFPEKVPKNVSFNFYY